MDAFINTHNQHTIVYSYCVHVLCTIGAHALHKWC